VDFMEAEANKAAESKIWGGIHHLSDTVAGLALGRKVGGCSGGEGWRGRGLNDAPRRLQTGRTLALDEDQSAYPRAYATDGGRRLVFIDKPLAWVTSG